MGRRALIGLVVAAPAVATLGYCATREGKSPSPSPSPSYIQRQQCSSRAHYEALLEWNALKDPDKRLGVHVGELYAEAWVQRFEEGVVIHPSRIEDWGQGPPANFDHSIIVLARDGAWFARIRPDTQPISDLDTLRALLDNTATLSSVHDELPLAWTRRGDAQRQQAPLSADELARLYRPHCIGDGRKSLGGGIAAAYVKFGLVSYIGRPIEEHYVQAMLLRVFTGGFSVGPLPRPGFSVGDAPAQLSSPIVLGTCNAKGDALDAVYELAVRRSNKDVESAAVDRAAGGVDWANGAWRVLQADPPRAEVEARPAKGFICD